MIRPHTALLISACMFAATARAQDKPNFAGRWAIEAAAAGGRGGRGAGGGGGGAGRVGDMGSGWGSPITVTQDAAKLVVEYAFFSRGDMQAPLKFIYALDGSETSNTVMMGRGNQTQTSKVAWDGANLVITTMHPFQNPTNGQEMKAEVRQALTLESPTSLVVETTRVGVLGGPTTTTRTLYTKQP